MSCKGTWQMTCLVSTKKKEEDGTYTVLVTCLGCGYSMRISNDFKSVICLSCGSKLHKTKYLSKVSLINKIKELEKEINDELSSVARTVVAGFSPAKPFSSYRENRKKLQRISALPGKINQKNK
jgi:RNase P subunit RPR2